MPSIVYRTDPKNGYVYAYESRSFRDPVTKKPRTKQTYLGRVDPVTHEIRPKGENGKRNRTKPQAELDELRKQMTESHTTMKGMNEALANLQEKVDRSDAFFDELKALISRYEEAKDAVSAATQSSGEEL